jgi:hypothetical protein
MHLGIKKEILELAKIYNNFWGLVVYTKKTVFIDSGAEISKSLENNELPNITKENGNIYALVRICRDSPFGEKDKLFSEVTGLPIFYFQSEIIEYFPRTYKPNLQGLPFIWGLFDCISLARHYYIWKRKFYIEDHDRDTDVIERDGKLLNSHLKNGILNKYFYNTEDRIMIEDDLLVFKSNKAHEHHVGVFVGNNKMIHHPLNTASEVTPLGVGYLKSIKHVFRLK